MSNSESACQKVQIGVLGVGSAQLLVSDPARLLLAIAMAEMPSLEEMCGVKPSSKVTPSLLSSRGEPIAAVIRGRDEHDDIGVTFMTGFGDGLYPVYATVVEFPRWGKRIVKVEIDFLTDQIRKNLRAMGYTLQLPPVEDEGEKRNERDQMRWKRLH